MKLERLLVGEFTDDTIGRTEIGFLWSFFRKYMIGVLRSSGGLILS